MSWIIPALLSPVFFAAVNHIDKQLLSRFFKGGGAGSLVLFSSLVSLPVLLLIWVFQPQVVTVERQYALMLLVNGAIYMASIIPYFYAMAKDEASVVAPLFQMVSPISYVLATVFLREQIQGVGLIGGLMVMLGAVLVSLEFSPKGKISLKREVFLLMILASTLSALNGLFFKSAAIQLPSFWTSAFWEYMGILLFGVITYCFIPVYRKQFHEVLQLNNGSILALNGINEACAVLAKLLLHFATLLAPLAMVFWIAEGFQPFFVFVMGVIITVFFPKLSGERLEKEILIQKTVAIGIMIIGTLILLR